MTGPAIRTDRPTVLVVDGCRPLAETFEELLAEDYDVRTATDAPDALELLDDALDVVLLDRQLPDLCEREVLETIRDRGLSCRLAAISSVDPHRDDREMAVEEYLVKPVTRSELLGMVDRLARRAAYDRAVRRSYALASSLSGPESGHTSDQPATDGGCSSVRRELGALQIRLDSMAERLADRDVSDEWNYYPSPSD